MMLLSYGRAKLSLSIFHRSRGSLWGLNLWPQDFLSGLRLLSGVSMRQFIFLVLLGFIAISGGLRPASGQPVFTRIFPPEEFAARRAIVMAKIGNGVAILQGTTERPGEQPLRQSNQFYYLSGVVEPRAILVIDGKRQKA